MKTFIRAALAGVAFAALGIAPINAQTTTNFSNNANKVPPRQLADQATHYIRTQISFTMCTQVSNACVVKFTTAALPYNAIVTRVYSVVYTAFNSTTSDSLALGISKASANELVTSINLQTGGLTAATVVAATSPGVTGAGATQTGDDGGFNLWAKWTAGTGNTATQGLADIVVEYIAPNDGTCTSVPLGSTAAAC